MRDPQYGAIASRRGASEAADRVEAAVDAALRDGLLTPDVGGACTTEEVGTWIADHVAKD